MGEALIWGAGLLLAIVGLAGAVLPIIPGPILSFLAMLVVFLGVQGQGLGWGLLIGMGVMSVVLMVLDYVVPALGARRFGATRAGIWGSIIGMILGVFLLPGWGIIVGAFAGAVVGELWAGQSTGTALRAGWGVFLGNLLGVGLKLAYGVTVLVMLIRLML